MDYWLDIKTADPEGLMAAVEADAMAAGASHAVVSADGIGLHGEPEESRHRGAVELLSLLLTIPVGITIEVAADQVKSYLARLRHRVGDRQIREVTIRWTEESVDADGNVTTNEREKRVELDDS
ncbi:hypothetical protein ACFWWC_44115 [Streptomyces sp. NPDC058642]|uniref:hypothetical protein n=1 Tax=Streptomyces sp. NPDC058642 TaxID=3346572 RepID=UPI003662525A